MEKLIKLHFFLVCLLYSSVIFAISDAKNFTNDLIHETSPYLLQHAHNPVNWKAWNEKAFKLAQKLNRPILLSIGYSTCHWCHVMKEESFEDVEIAKYLNDNYIAIKVDREERPDIDAVYMKAVQLISGNGGWPMTVWLTPDKKPIYGGTYYPARDGDRGSHTGFLTLLKKFKKIYDSNPTKVKKVSNEVVAMMQNRERSQHKSMQIDKRALNKLKEYFNKHYDSKWGGMSGAPKFPSSFPVHYYIRSYAQNKNKQDLKRIHKTLKAMALGGVYDHIGGGFHRYSTDEKWLVPHFEKMLYDNALLASLYLDAYQLTHDESYKDVAIEILDFLVKEMQAEDGGFYSAIDADSIWKKKRREGYFYTWTYAELKKNFNKTEFKKIGKYFNISKKGSFAENRNILSLKINIKKDFKKIKKKLYRLRAKRQAPVTDKKRLASWNALVISAFSKAAFMLGSEHYLSVAKKTAQFIETRMLHQNTLYRSYNKGKRNIPAYLEDYAFSIAAFMDLYQVSGEIKWLQLAISLDAVLESQFEDKKQGGFYRQSHSSEKILVREKPVMDGAIPAGNAIMAMNLLRLHEFTTHDGYRKRVDRLFNFFTNDILATPMRYSWLLAAWDYHQSKSKEIILVAPAHKRVQDSQIYKLLQTTFLPNKTICLVNNIKELKKQAKVIPLLSGKIVFDNKVTAFVCERGICKLPTTDPKVFLKQIKK